MPTYDYRCSSCDHRFELVQSFHDAPVTDCPECGTAGSVRKVYGSVGVVLKGPGFYRTDNRSGGGKSSNGSSSSDSSSTKSDSSGSSGSKDSGSSKSESSSTAQAAAS